MIRWAYRPNNHLTEREFCLMLTLDTPAEYAKLDAGRMLHFLRELPEVAEAAFERGQAAALPIARPTCVLICGMGGSAISGDLIRTQLLGACDVPVVVHRGDKLPRFAGPDTLAIFMSYSGNTGETLGCLREAIARGVPSLVVTHGGEAGRLAEQHGLSAVSMPAGWMPRAALGDLFFALLGVVSQLAGCEAPDVVGAVAQLRALRERIDEQVPTKSNPAKRLALALHGKTPVMVGATPTTEAVAVRWKCQLNENAKQTALLAVLPEATHNDIVNLTASTHSAYHLVVVSDPEDSEFVRRQRAITLDLMRPFVGGVHEVVGEGDSLLSRQLTAIYMGDYVSVYLAFLKGVDPTPVDTIFSLKDRMKAAMEGVR
jgi:glucose/mannose-6-phosphate isomerase